MTPPPGCCRAGRLARRMLAGLLLAWSLAVAAQPVLALQEDDPAVRRLADQVALWVDPAGLPDPVAWPHPQDPGFQRPGHRALSPGYSSATHWLRLQLHNPGLQPQERILVLEPARLESVALFWRGSVQPAWQRQVAGTDHPFSERALPMRESAFHLSLAPGESRELLLRVASRGSIALEPSLWRPVALLAEQRLAFWMDGLLLALPMLLALLATGLYLALRLPIYGLTAAYLLLALLYESAMRGTAFMLLWPDATDWAQRALGVLGIATTVMQVMTMAQVLALRRHQPRLHRALQLVMVLDLLALGPCLWGDYRQATQWAGLLNVLLGLLALAASVRALPGGSAPSPASGVASGGVMAGAWCAALLSQHLGILPRYLSLLGLVPHSTLADYAAPLAGSMGGMAVLGALLWQLHQEQARRAQTLEAAVHERTAELARVSAQAQASDAAKGRLLGYIGHDLRAPLASMVQLARRLEPARDFDANRRAIEHGGLMLLDTIDELQRFARRPDAEAELEVVAAPVYLHGLLLEVLRQAQAVARSGGNRLRLQRAPELPPVVELDARRLRQVLFNLLSNAAKFTRDGDIVLDAAVVGGQLQLAVRDTGRGIASTDLALVFEPFMRAVGPGHVPGLGLGLGIARQAVRAMGGDIRVQSRLGLGSCFHVDLPLRLAEEEDVLWPAPAPAPPPLEPGNGRRALVLDPCANVREALAERLALAGFDVILRAATPAQALALAPPDAPPPLLLILEPRTPGLAPALALLRERHPGLRLLRCSACPQDPDELAKPVSDGDWWAALNPLPN